MLSRLWGSNRMMDVEVLYQLGVKEMLPVAMIVTSEVFQFLLQFYSYITVHFVFGNCCTSGSWPPKSQKRCDALVLNQKMTYLTSILQL